MSSTMLLVIFLTPILVAAWFILWWLILIGMCRLWGWVRPQLWRLDE